MRATSACDSYPPHHTAREPVARAITEPVVTQDNIRRCIELRAFGKTKSEIAEALGISERSVARAFARGLEVPSLDSLPVSEVRRNELLKLDFAERELLDAWFLSKLPHEETTRRTERGGAGDTPGAKSSGAGAKSSVQVKTITSIPDCKIIATLGKIMERRHALLGLDAPKKIGIIDEQKRAFIGMFMEVFARRAHAAGLPTDFLKQLADDLRSLMTSGDGDGTAGMAGNETATAPVGVLPEPSLSDYADSAESDSAEQET